MWSNDKSLTIQQIENGFLIKACYYPTIEEVIKKLVQWSSEKIIFEDKIDVTINIRD